MAAAAGFSAAAACVLYAVFTSKSSTAAVGLLFVPVYGAAAGALSYAVAFAVLHVRAIARRERSVLSTGTLLATATLALVGWGALCYALRASSLAIAGNPVSSEAALREQRARWLPWGRADVDLALAKNPGTPVALLDLLAREGNASVAAAVAENASTPVATLEWIASGPRSYDRDGGLARNPNLPPALMEKIASVTLASFQGKVEYELYQTFVLAGLVRHKRLPPALFERLAAWPDPAYFLAVAVVYADASTCTQIARFANSDNAVLASTAAGQLQRKNCP
ncbi:MAG: hypothetical protein HY075_07970 [Deltaproteobacteria bacterium]|nr:hypothetical protein [Deltaproteobacteria bacterium]